MPLQIQYAIVLYKRPASEQETPMDASVSCFRSATFLCYLLAASLLLLLTPVPSVVRASSDGTIDKLAEQVRQQVADSRTKARPAARPSTGILIDRELLKLERYAGEQFTRSATKDKPAPARRLVLERLLTKLHDRAAVNALAAVALQTSAEQISYGDTSQGSVLAEISAATGSSTSATSSASPTFSALTPASGAGSWNWPFYTSACRGQLSSSRMCPTPSMPRP
jgi:hypothetical protein